MTLHIRYEHLPKPLVEALLQVFDRITCYDPMTGESHWETFSWKSVRSDSHTVAVRPGSDRLSIQGSPARVMGNGDNTFGHPRHHSNMALCAQALIDAAAKGLSALTREKGGFGSVALPSATWMVEELPTDLDALKSSREWTLVVDPMGDPDERLLPRGHLKPAWTLGRLDITYNYALGSLEDVRSALSILRGVEGGRYKVDSTAGDSVYWAKRSRRRKGKAYAKGPHLAHLIRKNKLTHSITAAQLAAADRLLRLEMTVLGKWLVENLPRYTRSKDARWWYLEPDALAQIHDSFFGEMIGQDDVPMTDRDLYARVVGVAPSEGQGRAAWMTWLSIKSQGWDMTRAMLPRATWYRHRSILRDAGLSDADLSLGQVVPLRRSPLLTMDPVTSWSQLVAA